MKHLIKLMSEDCTYMCVINPDHIVKFYEEDDNSTPISNFKLCHI